MPFKTKEVIRMAKIKLAVVESGAEQAVMEPEAGIDSRSAPEISAVPEGDEALAPELTSEESAILAQEGETVLREIGEEQLEPPTPFDIGGEHVPDSGDVVVLLKKIEELVSERKAAARQAK